MNAEKTYNGWTNYETWCVYTWQTNERADSEWLETMAFQCFDEADGDSEKALSSLADLLKDEYSDNLPETPAITGFCVDMLRAALDEVNWVEVADNALTSLSPIEGDADGRAYVTPAWAKQREASRVREAAMAACKAFIGSWPEALTRDDEPDAITLRAVEVALMRYVAEAGN